MQEQPEFAGEVIEGEVISHERGQQRIDA